MMGSSTPVSGQRGSVVNSAEAGSRAPSLLPPISLAVDGLVYAGIVLCSITAALIGTYNVDADTVAYLDLSNAIRNHQWHALVNASWFPVYPALLTVGRACFSFRPQYDIMAARLVDSALNILLLLACVLLAAVLRQLTLNRGIDRSQLLPRRTLFLWTATFSYYFVSQDLIGIKPDTFVSIFLILGIAALLWGRLRRGFLPYVVAGMCGGVAFLGKAFALPVFVLLLFLAACVNLRRPRILLGLFISLSVFGLTAGPLIWQISAQKGRVTIGDSGRLNTAWYVNGADRFNPVNDPVYHQADALGTFVHPGELLWREPEITYYGGDKVYGSTPQWDDFSYWSDGLHSRFILHETVGAVIGNAKSLIFTMMMRIQAFLLIAALIGWGFSVPRRLISDPDVLVLSMLAFLSTASLTLVHLETRYVAFSLILLGVLFAACAVAVQPSATRRSLHLALALGASLILVGGFQNSLKQFKTAAGEGADPLKGIYSAAVLAAGQNLATLYPRGTEVACIGDSACWSDPLWTEYAGVKMTAIIETGPGGPTKSAEEGCEKIERNPAIFESLRQHHVRAIVGRFNKPIPCSPAWKPLEESGQFFYLPL
jgi:hypothetical protein